METEKQICPSGNRLYSLYSVSQAHEAPRKGLTPPTHQGAQDAVKASNTRQFQDRRLTLEVMGQPGRGQGNTRPEEPRGVNKAEGRACGGILPKAAAVKGEGERAQLLDCVSGSAQQELRLSGEEASAAGLGNHPSLPCEPDSTESKGA